MNHLDDIDDEQLLVLLRDAALACDPVPPLLVETAQAVYGLHRLDAELAQLVHDSYDAEPVLALRSAPGAVNPGAGELRMLSFQVGPLQVELQVAVRGEVRDLVAHVSGVELAAAWLDTEQHEQQLATEDEVLLADGVPGGPVRLRLKTVDGDLYATSWTTV